MHLKNNKFVYLWLLCLVEFGINYYIFDFLKNF